MTDLQTVRRWIKDNDDYVILMHASPDGDAVGSAHALCRVLEGLGKRARCACCDPIPARFRYMTDGVGEAEFEPRHVIAVDLADTKLLGELRDEYEGRIELSIDHHVSNRLDVPMSILDGAASAACEVLYGVLLELGVAIDPEIAACLYTGIATDTGCFKFTNTSARTHEIAAALIRAGAPYGEINRLLFETKSPARLQVEKMALESIEFHFDRRCALLVVTKEMQEMTTSDELDGITGITRQIEGVDVGLTLRYKGENRYKISARTVEPYDASAICARLGGGGHLRAAGCELEMPIDQAKETILACAAEELGCTCKG